MPFVAKVGKAPSPTQRVNEEMLNNILARISQGCPHRLSCEANRLSYTHFKLFLAQGRVDEAHGLDTMHSRFLFKLKNLECEQVKNRLAKMDGEEIGKDSARWFLERKYWKDFSANAETLKLAEEIEDLRADIETTQNKKVEKNGKDKK